VCSTGQTDDADLEPRVINDVSASSEHTDATKTTFVAAVVYLTLSFMS